MTFFRKWKTHYKHKKFSSDDTIEAADWGLTKCSNDPKNLENFKADSNCILEDDDESQLPLFSTYDVKYLGYTLVDPKRCEKQTANAIKTVLTRSKIDGRKNKTQKHVTLNVSRDGIEVLDQQSHDTLMKFSIYKISYCSVDATHNHMFSFVGSEKDPLSNGERTSCHVFHCPKRKLAHEITLMVARCFENAYQQWRDAVVSQANKQGKIVDNTDPKKVLEELNSHRNITAAQVHQPQNLKEEQLNDNLLIDFAASDNGMQKYLQTAWVSFDDDKHDGVKVPAF